MRTTVSADDVTGAAGEPLSPSVIKVDGMAKVESKTEKLKAFLEDAPPDVSPARVSNISNQ